MDALAGKTQKLIWRSQRFQNDVETWGSYLQESASRFAQEIKSLEPLATSPSHQAAYNDAKEALERMGRDTHRLLASIRRTKRR